jgi:hypothetical protein
VKRVSRLLSTALLLPWASGCMSFSGHFGSRIHVENLPRIEDGVTTREEITSWFGPPSAFYNPTFLDLIFVGDAEPEVSPIAPVLDDVYTYRHIENETRILFVPLLFALVRSEAESETLTVFFDEDGVVEYHAYRRDHAQPESD